jgi:uncharacterized membrane protein
MISIAHIHPMLVHFPIALLISGVTLDIISLLRKNDLAGRQCLPSISLSALLLGTLSAIVAAIFGDLAMDTAISLGFSGGPIKTHETVALITIAIFSITGLLRILTALRRYPLQGYIGWISVTPGVIGVILLITTAYYGGELVYHFGVNVAAIR